MFGNYSIISRTNVPNTEPTIAPEIKAAALEAAKKAIPRRYKLIGLAKNTPRFIVIGCAGSGDNYQKAVADLILQIAQDPSKKPDFIIFAGDNYYDNGVTSIDDPGFKKCFYDMYAELKIPCFVLFGNHEVKMHEMAYWTKTLDLPNAKNREIFQIAECYLPDENYKTVADKINFFESPTLVLKTAPLRMTPNNVFTLDAGDTEIIGLDSNFLAKEFLEFIKNPDDTSPYNQAKWLQSFIQQIKAESKKISIVLHHPPYHTGGKRANPAHYDYHHYLSPAELQALKEVLKTETNSYNELLALVLESLDVKPDKTFAAHDHFISIYDDGKHLQFTTGGGGGELQARLNFSGHPDVKCHLKNHGFIIDDGALTEIYTTTNYHLIYNNVTKEFMQEKIIDEQVAALRRLVLDTCDEYLHNLKQAQFIPAPQQNQTAEPVKSSYQYGYYVDTLFSSYKMISTTVASFSNKISHLLSDLINKDDYLAKEIYCVEDIKAYFNQARLTDMKEIMHELYGKTKFLIERKDNAKYPFYSMLENKLQKQWSSPEINLETLYRATNDISVAVTPKL